MIMWIVLLITPAIAAVLSGTVVGLFARARQCSEKRIRWVIFSGMGLLFILAAIIIQDRLHLPYPPGVLAKSGHPVLSFLAYIAPACIYGLCIPYAGKLAKSFVVR